MHLPALEFYREAVVLLKNLRDGVGLAITLYNIGTLFRDELNQPNEAQQYLDESRALATRYKLLELLRRLER